MSTLRDWNGVEHEVKYRSVSGYYNRSTYEVDVDNQHVMTVRRISDATWNRSATWSAYETGTTLHIATDRSRADVVKTALRRIYARRES